jgi:hypothetical protein
MPAIASRVRSCLGAALFLFALGSGPAAFAQSGRTYFLPNNLLLSRVVYDSKRSNVVVGMLLPPGCAPANCVSAITSTVSGNGDQGADPKQLVVISDTIAAATLPTAQTFSTLQTAGFGEVLRGVWFTPGTRVIRR